ncbi:MAG TPA: hypothetical protein VD968_08305 [Pyrinomonadaceae bacterium]|nr:hypothetical protein [Pyrinomonadaceae bacterium]
MEEFLSNLESAFMDRRALPRVAPQSKLWAAVENTTRNEMLGMAEVADFCGLGLALRQIADDPVAALGDRMWVTLVADEGVIPLRARLVHIRRDGLFGLKLEAPSEPGQLFLLRLYERLSSSAAAQSAG